MSVDVEVGLEIKVLNLVDPRLEFPILEYGREVAGRAQSHSLVEQVRQRVERASYNTIIIDYRSLTCASHTFALWEGVGVRHNAHLEKVSA